VSDNIAVPYFCSLPATPPPWPGVVVVMEGMGITPQLLRVCERLAREVLALADDPEQLRRCRARTRPSPR